MALYAFFGQLSRSSASPPCSAFLDRWEKHHGCGDSRTTTHKKQPSHSAWDVIRGGSEANGAGSGYLRCREDHTWNQGCFPITYQAALLVMGCFIMISFPVIIHKADRKDKLKFMWFISRETHHLMDRDTMNMSLSTGQKVPVITPPTTLILNILEEQVCRALMQPSSGL